MIFLSRNAQRKPNTEIKIMGLDMYAFSTAKEDAAKVFTANDESAEQIAMEEVFYWRKHPNLHGWMEKLYRERGGTEVFNCENVELSGEDLDRLEKDVQADALPETTGFFFGKSASEDKERDLEFIAKGREVLAQGRALFYSSWW